MLLVLSAHQAVQDSGKQLIVGRHYGSDAIQQRCDDLDKSWDELKKLSAARYGEEVTSSDDAIDAVTG